MLLSYPEMQTHFRTLRCVIVDEWHELLGTKRGTQTELGLARLRKWNPELRVWGLSATLGNLREACDVLMGAGQRSALLIAGPRQKKIQLSTLIPEDISRFPWSGHLGRQLVKPLAEAIDAARTTLLFTNTRSQVELWYQALIAERPDWIDKIALHHGSIGRETRREVEARLDAGDWKCVVCTSSLDLGVDFAPVEQVVQLGSPKGIARLMQRAGRSGHQPGAISRIVCVPTHSLELAEFAAAREGLRRRTIEARTPLEKPLDVLVQHLVTVAAGGGFEERALLAEIRSAWAFRDLGDHEWQWVLDFVTRGGSALRAYPQYARLTLEDGRYRVSSPQIERAHRMNIGTITSEGVMNVRMGNGHLLGTIEESFISRLTNGDCFTFAGRVLELVRVRDMTAYVRPARKQRGIVPRWNGGRFPLSTHLSELMRALLDAARVGRYHGREARALRPLIELQAKWSRVPCSDEILIEHTTTQEGDHWFVFPFEGRLVHEGLAALFAHRLARLRPMTIHVVVNDYGIELLCSSPLELREADWRTLFTERRLTEDLLECVNETQMARRQFRDIARIAGLVVSGFPGERRAARHLQASSELFFDVFTDFDPGNLLMDQSRREVLDRQLEFRRLATALERLERARLVLVETERLSPLAFPLYAEQLRAQHVTSEKWGDRVRRMAEQLERTALQAKRVRRKGRSATVAAD